MKYKLSILPNQFVLVTVTAFFLAVSGLSAEEWVPGELLIKTKPGVTAAQLDSLNKTMGVTSVRLLKAANNDWQLIQFSPLDDVKDKAREYVKSGKVLHAEPNLIFHTETVDPRLPGDPSFDEAETCYQFNITEANYAWKTISEAPSVIVAVIDTGINYKHEDLKDNMWVNPSPTIGDIHGINIYNGTFYPDPMDDNQHGTLVAGVIGARGNNGLGTAGVAWNIQLMACKVTDYRGLSNTADIIEGIAYAREHGANIINISMGSDYDGDILIYKEEFDRCKEKGILIFCAAGNNSRDTDNVPHYPSGLCVQCDNVISVGGSDRHDGVYRLSNYGKKSVQLFAPCEDIYSTSLGYIYDPNSELPLDNSFYEKLAGTSMSSPFAAGAAALCMAAHPGENYLKIKERILQNVDIVPELSEKCSTGGRINVNNLVNDPLPLHIIEQPYPVKHIEGDSVTFSVTAEGNDLTYQWYRNGTAISGAVNDTCFIDPSMIDDADIYTVSVSQNEETVFCNPARTILTNLDPGYSFTIDHLKYTVLTADSIKKTATVSVGDDGWTQKDLTIASFQKGAYQFTVTELNDSAFENNGHLVNVDIRDGMDIIRGRSFANCVNLETITLPSHISILSWYAFNNCARLKSITIPEGVTEIPDYTFEGCGQLSQVNLPGSLQGVWTRAFASCTNLPGIVLPDGMTFIGRGSFTNCISLKTITIPDSISWLDDNAFSGCSSLESFWIPAALTFYGYDIFTGCTSLRSIDASPDTIYFSSVDGVLYNKEKTALLIYPAGKEASSYIVPEGVTGIATRAFSCCQHLESVTFPYSLSYMRFFSMEKCENLKQLYFKGYPPETDLRCFDVPPITVYYLEGNSGWFDSWEGFPTKVWKIILPVSLDEQGLTIRYSGGVLQSSPDLKNWQNVPGLKDYFYTIPLSKEGSVYYRTKGR